MFGLIGRLFAGEKRVERRGGFRPSVEALEGRDVASASSGALHAVAPPAGHPTQQNDFYIDATSHLLAYNNFALNGRLGSPVGVTTLSAGHNALGGADVFVKDGVGAFWRWDGGISWTRLRGANVVQNFAAVNGGRVYAVFGDGTLHEYNGSVWSSIPTATTVSSIDAVTDTSGRDTVFARLTDGSFWDYQQFAVGGPFVGDKLAGGIFSASRVTTFSAGLDALGNADVYATFKSFVGTSNLEKTEAGSPNGWTFVASGSTYKDFSATNNGAVWVAGSDGSVSEYDRFGHKVNSVGSFVGAAHVSAASDRDVYIVATDHTVSEWVNYPVIGSFEMITGIGAAQI